MVEDQSLESKLSEAARRMVVMVKVDGRLGCARGHRPESQQKTSNFLPIAGQFPPAITTSSRAWKSEDEVSAGYHDNGGTI